MSRVHFRKGINRTLDEIHFLEVAMAQDFLNRASINPLLYHARRSTYLDRISELQTEVSDHIDSYRR